jgi:hypothetical protein
MTKVYRSIVPKFCSVEPQGASVSMVKLFTKCNVVVVVIVAVAVTAVGGGGVVVVVVDGSCGWCSVNELIIQWRKTRLCTLA